MPLPLLAPLLIGSGVQMLGGLASNLIGAKKNKEELERLAAERARTDRELSGLREQLKTGKGFGLSGIEADVAQRRMLDPLRGLATERRSREAGQLATSGGVISGADISRLRTEGAREMGKAAESAGVNLQTMDIQKQASDRAAAEQRYAATQAENAAIRQEEAQRQAARQQAAMSAITGVTEGLSGMAGTAGELAGMNPEQRAQALWGKKAADLPGIGRALTDLGVSPEIAQNVMDMAGGDPQRLVDFLTELIAARTAAGE